MYFEAAELKSKQDIEDEKNKAADMAVNRLIQDENDLNRIFEDIANVSGNQNQDKFTRKLCLIVCNEHY